MSRSSPSDHLDADLFQRGRHVGGIVGRIGERARVRVGRIADDQGDAFLRGSRLNKDERGGRSDDEVYGGGSHAEGNATRAAMTHHGRSLFSAPAISSHQAILTTPRPESVNAG